MPGGLRFKIEEKLNENDVLEGFGAVVDMAKIFNQLDTDASGDLTVRELKRGLRCLGRTSTDTDCLRRS